MNKKNDKICGFEWDIGYDYLYQYIMRDTYFEPFRKKINEPSYSVGDINATYRIINYWSSVGLLPERRQEGTEGWRRLSLKDGVWIQSMVAMREFGLSLDKARKAYSCIMVDEKGNERDLLDAAIIACFRKPPPAIFILVRSDGQAGIADLNSIDKTDFEHGYHNLLRISLNAIVKKLFSKALLPVAPAIRMDEEEAVRWYEHKNNEKLPSASEDAVLDALRQENVDAVTVKKKDKRITEIQTTTLELKDPKVFELLNSMNFGEINVKVQNGKPTHVRKTKKERIDEDAC